MIGKMGNKTEARATMIAAGIPVIRGTNGAVLDLEEGKKEAARIGYPVIIKAALGGGGKGMRTAQSEEEFESCFVTARKEAEKAFGDGTMYLEHFVEHPRHIEFQILADSYGNVIHLGERDCSIQRNHQKMVEESPSAALDEKTRQQMGEMAVKAARAVGYTNAGTVEFLLDKNKNFYFMEVNTRIQVEHGVTEMMTGVDLIKEQIKIASGEHLAIKQQDVKLSGAAIEMRINAENPYKKFAPCPGKISDLHIPGGNEVRVDTAVYTGYTIPPFYDSMIMKIIVHDKDRRQAINKMKSVLGEVVIDGITTNRDFQYEICNNKRFETGDITTDFIAQEFPDFI